MSLRVTAAGHGGAGDRARIPLGRQRCSGRCSAAIAIGQRRRGLPWRLAAGPRSHQLAGRWSWFFALLAPLQLIGFAWLWADSDNQLSSQITRGETNVSGLGSRISVSTSEAELRSLLASANLGTLPPLRPGFLADQKQQISEAIASHAARQGWWFARIRSLLLDLIGVPNELHLGLAQVHVDAVADGDGLPLPAVKAKDPTDLGDHLPCLYVRCGFPRCGWRQLQPVIGAACTFSNRPWLAAIRNPLRFRFSLLPLALCRLI